MENDDEERIKTLRERRATKRERRHTNQLVVNFSFIYLISCLSCLTHKPEVSDRKRPRENRQRTSLEAIANSYEHTNTHKHTLIYIYIYIKRRKNYGVTSLISLVYSIHNLESPRNKQSIGILKKRTTQKIRIYISALD